MWQHSSPGPAQDSSWDGLSVYQVYPRSFLESPRQTGEWRGEGNIRGVVDRLDYLSSLGLDAIWMSPFYPSPLIDGGYDITNHCDVDLRYGTLADFAELIEGAHQRGMRIMVDIIPNHTSNQHPWFQESRSSRDNPRSDWYIWHNPAPSGGPPNNWASVFSSSQLKARRQGKLDVAPGEPTPPLPAWTYDEARKQYYLHSFASEQPDLNWENPAVRAAIKDIIRFWAHMGVDGFRIDAANYIAKNPTLANEASDPSYREGIDNPYDQLIRHHSTGYPPKIEAYIRELAAVASERPGIYMILEAYMPEGVLATLARIDPTHASPFNFTRLTAPWDAAAHNALLSRYYDALPPGSVPNQVNGNHDKPRLATRLGEAAARAAAVINLTLPGMIFIYNGEEGGFTNVDVSQVRANDPAGDRNPARTPMLWTPERNAGFSRAPAEKLWLPVDPAYPERNLADQLYDPHSSLTLYARLLHMRRSSDVLSHGKLTMLATNAPDALVAFARRTDTREQVITAANFTGHVVSARIWRAEQLSARVILRSTTAEAGENLISLDGPIDLQPNEAVIITHST